ncbi:pseudouridine synthase [Shewanella avicenniae]|uniref:Pseudouridine synthase n=1 Tax=Shewanella avicenniae TaxID=2814294 RepID=A0ABX7QNP5_9GAMM|nr:pseudouridine synthase [Shewanella avicenniae]QSX33091.1 pseudouridine synthase [Shewanella avicenniae]
MSSDNPPLANQPVTVRLAHFIALAGVCSRRQAARLIEQQRITVNGALGTHQQRIDPNSSVQVRLDGELLCGQVSPIYWLYHKPVGIDCRLLQHDPTSLCHQLPPSSHCYPIGRLDKDSRGLLLISNDGTLTQRLLHPDFEHHKCYQVTVDKPLTRHFLESMTAGLDYGEGLTRPCQLQQLSENQFEICLTEGKKRQIRRMSRHLGMRVTDLLRTHIGELALGNLAEHCFRALTREEYQQLMALKHSQPAT